MVLSPLPDLVTCLAALSMRMLLMRRWQLLASQCCPPAAVQGGSVMGRVWQPHESHIPFLLQLKIDFNLAGMGWLRLSQARFR
jgi:hypothetical protein